MGQAQAAAGSGLDLVGTVSAAYRHLPVPIVVLDPAGRIVYANPAFVTLVDTRARQLQGRRLEEVVSGWHQPPGRPAVKAAGPGRGGARIAVAGRPARPVLLRHGRLDLGELSPYSVWLVEEVRGGADDPGFSETLALMAHELRTPLTSIKGFTELLLRAGDRLDEAKCQHYLHLIRQNADILVEQVEKMLYLHRLQAGWGVADREFCRLTEVIAEVLPVMDARAQLKGVRLGVRLGEDVPAVWADPDGPRQVVTNLLSNAIKFTPPGGDVWLDVEAAPESVVIRVRDTGIGIPEPERNRVFEKFYRSDRPTGDCMFPGGFGLGLYLVKSIVDRHRGRIVLESQVGRGTTFTVIFPREGDDECAATKGAGD